MIGLPYFEERRAAAEAVLASASGLVSTLTGSDAALRLVPELDGERRRRILALNVEVFGREGEVFDGRALDEVAADPDALLVVLDVAGRTEGFVFGYYEEPAQPVVPGADFFFDTGAVAPRWRGRGLGLRCAAAVLLLTGLLGDVHRIGLAVWNAGAVDALVALYGRLGFADAQCSMPGCRCLAVDVDAASEATWRALLDVPAMRPAAPDGSPRR